jgi:hypothetical protein
MKLLVIRAANIPRPTFEHPERPHIFLIENTHTAAWEPGSPRRLGRRVSSPLSRLPSFLLPFSFLSPALAARDGGYSRARETDTSSTPRGCGLASPAARERAISSTASPLRRQPTTRQRRRSSELRASTVQGRRKTTLYSRRAGTTRSSSRKKMYGRRKKTAAAMASAATRITRPVSVSAAPAKPASNPPNRAHQAAFVSAVARVGEPSRRARPASGQREPLTTPTRWCRAASR